MAATTNKIETTYGNCSTAAESRRQSICSDFENAWARSLLEPCRRLGFAEREIIELFHGVGCGRAANRLQMRWENESWVMWSWEKVKTAFTSRGAVPSDTRRLNGSTEGVLSASVKLLPLGERGWITLREAAALFSRMDDQYAFGEMDEQGKANLEAFAAQREHRCDVQFAPVESRVYFIRT